MNQLAPVTTPYRPNAGDNEPPRPLRRALPPAEDFPVGRLGKTLEEATRAVQDKVQAPTALCAQSVIATATLAVQALANVEMPGGRRKPLSEFFVTIAESGERKTSADDEASWCIRKHEENLREGYSTAQLDWQNVRDVWESRRKSVLADKDISSSAAKKAALSDLGPEPTPPPAPIIQCEEPTPEGLAKLLRIGMPSIGIFTSEGGRFLGGHAMNDENKIKTATALSSMWDGSPIKRVRQGDEVSFLYGRRVAMHLMLQPALAPRLLADDVLIGQGLLSRVLLVAPETAAGTRFWREASAESEVALRHYGQRCLHALETPPLLKEGTSNELEPRPLPMCATAQKQWIAYADHVEAQLGPEGTLAPIRGWSAKQPEHAARLAGVLALIENLQADEISSQCMEGGIALADHYATEALRLHLAGQDDPNLVLAEKALRWIINDWPRIQRDQGYEPLGYISKPDLYQFGPNAIRTAAKAKQVMRVLEEHGWVVRQEQGAVTLGGHRRDAWIVRNGFVE